MNGRGEGLHLTRYARSRSFDSRLRRSLTMTVCGAAIFHPVTRKPYVPGAPILRRAALSGDRVIGKAKAESAGPY